MGLGPEIIGRVGERIYEVIDESVDLPDPISRQGNVDRQLATLLDGDVAGQATRDGEDWLGRAVQIFWDPSPTLTDLVGEVGDHL